MYAWRDLFVPAPVLHALAEDGFTSPTPIQTLTLPAAIRDRRDIVGAAETVGYVVVVNDLKFSYVSVEPTCN